MDNNEALELMPRLDPARFKLSVDVVKVNRPRRPSPGSEMVRMAVVLWLRLTCRRRLFMSLLLQDHEFLEFLNGDANEEGESASLNKEVLVE